MCDQLSSVGVEFSRERMDGTFRNSLQYSAAHPFPMVPPGIWSRLGFPPQPEKWALPEIFSFEGPKLIRDSANCPGSDRHPTSSRDSGWLGPRPWGLGQTREAGDWVQSIPGRAVRQPGFFKRTDTETNKPTSDPLINTNERIHSSVRIRLACGGLSLDDAKRWTCHSLRECKSPKDENGRPLWRLENESGLKASEISALKTFLPNELSAWKSEYAEENKSLYSVKSQDGQWRWKFRENSRFFEGIPHEKILPEEPMVGYWERYLLNLTVGQRDVWRWAEENPPTDFYIKE